MTSSTRAILATLALSLIAVGCGGSHDVRSSPNTNSTSAASPGGSSSTTGAPATTVLKAVQPAAAKASKFVGGNVDPAFGAGEAGKLSVVAVGTPDGKEDTIPFVVRNNTTRPVYAVEATGRATDGGKLVGSGESQSTEPAVVAPGEIAFGYVYFSSTPPVGATVDVTATADSKQGSFMRSVAMTIGETNLIPGEFGSNIVGEVKAPADVEVDPPVKVLVLCVDAAGTLGGTSIGFTDGAAPILPGATATYSVGTPDACPTFLVASSGYEKSK